MTTVEDACTDGWTCHANGIMTNHDSNSVLDALIGETGQLYVKRLGDDDVFKPYRLNTPRPTFGLDGCRKF